MSASILSFRNRITGHQAIEEGARAAAPPTVAVTDDSTGIVDLSSAESEPQGVLPTDEENFEAPAAEQESADLDSPETPWNPKAPSGEIWNRR